MTAERVAALERDTLRTGEIKDRGGDGFHVWKRYDAPIGWDDGKEALWLRAELKAGSLHSHPRKEKG